jgi:hypothetical protein
MTMSLLATGLWAISPELVLAADEHLGPPVDSYVNGSQTWFEDIARDEDLTLELRMHPVARYTTPKGLSHYDLWETIVGHLSLGGDPHAIRLGDEVRPLTAVWDGMECYAAYGERLEPDELATLATRCLDRAPDRVGMVDHEAIGDAWERAQGNVSVVALLLEQLTP